MYLRRKDLALTYVQSDIQLRLKVSYDATLLNPINEITTKLLIIRLLVNT